jgi:enamine deaminase RidA (YjgF/YER057c/UK114 family)
MDIYKRLQEKGIVIPELRKPVASYVPAKVFKELIFSSGQSGTVHQKLKYIGKLGKDITIEQGRESARLAILNCLAALEYILGDLNKVEEIIKVTGYVASAEGFKEQPAVIEGASTLLLEIFGEKGKHARSAIGVAELPFGAPVEVELIARIKE